MQTLFWVGIFFAASGLYVGSPQIYARIDKGRRWWALLSMEGQDAVYWFLGGLVLLTGFMFS